VTILVSDIEGTLTTGSSWRAIQRYYKDNFNPWVYHLFFTRWIPRYLLVKMGLFSRRAAMVGWMQEEIKLFRGFSPEAFEEMAEWVVSTEMWPKRRGKILSELEQHRREGLDIVLVSSAYQPFVAAFAQRMDAIPIGSPIVYHEGRLVGLQLPINAYEDKAQTLRYKFPGSEIRMAYGDTGSDIAMMELSQMPVAVNPDEELRITAEIKGWRIIECTPRQS